MSGVATIGPSVTPSVTQNAMTLLTNACQALADKAIQGFEVNLDNLNAVLNNNPILYVLVFKKKLGSLWVGLVRNKRFVYYNTLGC